MSKWTLAQRENAARVAIRIVRKFPQIEQAVLAPMLMREIGHAILEATPPALSESAGRPEIPDSTPHTPSLNGPGQPGCLCAECERRRDRAPQSECAVGPEIPEGGEKEKR